MPLRDKDQKFSPQPKGVKTSIMLSAEKRIGHTLEKDWNEYYFKRKYSLRKMAQRWGIRRTTLSGFKNRQGWIKILGLGKRKGDNQIRIKRGLRLKPIKRCELCGIKRKKLVDAHFIQEKDGGPKCFFNILKLCQNCHADLDEGDNKTITKARKVLFLKANKALKLRLPPWRW